MTWSELEMILFNVRHCSVTRWRCSEDRDAMCCLLPRSTRCARYPGGSLLGLLHSTGCCVIVQRIPVHCCWMLPLIRCLLEQIGGRRTVSTSIPPDTADWRTLRPRCSGFLTRSCSLGWSGPSMTPPVRTLRQLLVTLSGFVATQCRGLRGECAGVRRVRAWLPRMTRGCRSLCHRCWCRRRCRPPAYGHRGTLGRGEGMVEKDDSVMSVTVPPVLVPSSVPSTVVRASGVTVPVGVGTRGIPNVGP